MIPTIIRDDWCLPPYIGAAKAVKNRGKLVLFNFMRSERMAEKQ
jgi:hypothetical protein